ncbi:Reduced growth phenotype protein 1 [Cryptosporidium felis]|nr:Reduced growth phenotype protein 1 [Cryptosporidium felis]
MINAWSLGRFPSSSGSVISSAVNNIGLFAYSINSRIIVLDVNSMIDGNNGNIILRSNTLTRLVIEIQGKEKTVQSWKNHGIGNSSQIISDVPSRSNTVNVKSVFINGLQWGPFTRVRWSILFSSLNNGLIHMWLVPNVDSYSLSDYLPTPCFELLGLIKDSATGNGNTGILEFDWELMRPSSGDTINSFCSEFMLNSDCPVLHSCVSSVQSSLLSLEEFEVFLLTVCWGDFFVIYLVQTRSVGSGSCQATLGRILESGQSNLEKVLPVLPQVKCRPLLISALPNKKVNEIISSCFLSEFWSIEKELFFELYTGSSEGNINLFKFSVPDSFSKLNCLSFHEVKRIKPSIPISHLNLKVVFDAVGKREHVWLASACTEVLMGRVALGDMASQTLEPENKIYQQMSIRSVKRMDRVVYGEKMFETAFFTVDQGGLGILHLVNLENNTFSSVKVLTMSRLTASSSVFPNLDQVTEKTDEDSEDPSKSLTKNISFDSLQNVPSSIQSIRMSSDDFRLVSFENCLVPSPFNFEDADLLNYSLAMVVSSKLNTIRLIVVFNNISPMESICTRVKQHFKYTNNSINEYCSESPACLEKLTRAISGVFTLNDVRLVLGGPLTMHKIPLLDEGDEKEANNSQALTKASDCEGPTTKPNSFLNYKFGKMLESKISCGKSGAADNEDESGILDQFCSIFFEAVPEELVECAASQNSIDEDFPCSSDKFYEISRPVFSNLVLLIICYIAETEQFIPNSMSNYIAGCKDKSTCMEELVRFLSSLALDLASSKQGSVKPEDSDNSMLSVLFKTLLTVRIINSLRCFVFLLYLRSNETVDSQIIKREESMSNYLSKLHYYLQLQIVNFHTKVSATDPVHNYIWNCMKTSNPILLTQIDQLTNNHFQELIDSSCFLTSEFPYSIYQCREKRGSQVQEDSKDSQPEACSKVDCIYSAPICPITFLPVKLFSGQKHLACNSCGKVVFLPSELVEQKGMSDGLYPCISFFERLCLQNNYFSCQICLSPVDLLEI